MLNEICAVADQAAKAQAEVEVSLQEAVDILTAATKGCGSYAKPILRHITTVADFAKKEGIQVHTTLQWSQYTVNFSQWSQCYHECAQLTLLGLHVLHCCRIIPSISASL